MRFIKLLTGNITETRTISKSNCVITREHYLYSSYWKEKLKIQRKEITVWYLEQKENTSRIAIGSLINDKANNTPENIMLIYGLKQTKRMKW